MASESASPSVSPSGSPSSSPSNSPSKSPSMSPSGSPSKSPSASPSASPSPMPAGQVEYTVHGQTVRIGKKRMTFATVAFGGTSDAYPDGGIPITKEKLGFGSQIDALLIMETNAAAYTFEYDRSAETIRMFTSFGVEETAYATLAAYSLEVVAFGW